MTRSRLALFLSTITITITITLALAPAGNARSDDGRSTEPPVVVLIGDSIRMGYAPAVTERLKGVAEVVSPEENGGDSANVLKNLDAWLIRRKPTVVHINAGLHDLKTDKTTGAKQVALEAYRRNLETLLERLERETSARLIYATTTPVIDARHQAVRPFARHEADVVAYNKAALEVVAGHPKVRVNDLHALVMNRGPERMLGADGVHFDAQASAALGEAVAIAVTQALREPPVTRAAVARWAAEPPKLDGKLDDPVWEAATVIEHFPSFWAGTTPPDSSATRARLVWDNDALYFSATLTDHELKAFGTKHNDHLWNGDVFELFFKPSAEGPAYYEFQTNPNQAIFEVAFPKRGEFPQELSKAPVLGMTTVVRLDGTLDKPGDKDRGWSVEGRIPWSIFKPTGGRPKAGDVWNFALCRYDYGPEGTEPILMSSAPLTKANFHRHEDYGRLTFEGPRR